MEHLAVDLGGRKSQVCIRSSDGTILLERKYATSRLAQLFATREHSRVIIETTSEAFAVADAAVECGHEVRIVPATLVRTLGVGARGIKTDQRDARVLSDVSCRIDLPSVHLPRTIIRERKATCTARESLLKARTSLINSVRGWLRTQLQRIPTGHVSTFPKRVMLTMSTRSEGLPEPIARQLNVIQALNQQIADANAELRQIAEQDELCQRLMTVPGVGPVIAVQFTSALDDIQRFPGAEAVTSYLGLTPKEHSSSSRTYRGGITKAGPAGVRKVLVQGSWTLWRCRPNAPAVVWARKIADRRGKSVAIVALARKLATILFAIWRDHSVYSPSQGAKMPT